MKIFLTGGTGYVGSAILEALLKGGHAVTALSRSPAASKRLAETGAEAFPANLREPGTFSHAVAAHDAVIHAGAETSPEWAEIEKKMLEALLASLKNASTPKALIYTSGVWVLGNTGNEPVDEEGSTSHPAALVAWRPSHERMVLQAASGMLAAAVVRPGIVYGGSGGICASFFLSAQKDGAASFIGDGKNRWTMVYRHDLALLYRMLAEKRQSGIFHAVDETPLMVEEIAVAASHAAGKSGAVKSVPLEEALQKLGTFADALALNQVVAAKHAKAIGWKASHAPFTSTASSLFEEFKGEVKSIEAPRSTQ